MSKYILLKTKKYYSEYPEAPNLLFNTGLSDLLLTMEDCNLPCISGKNIEKVLNSLENVSPNLFQ